MFRILGFRVTKILLCVGFMVLGCLIYFMILGALGFGVGRFGFEG